MWHHLGHVALADGHIAVAQYCAAALGDVARAAYLQETLDGIEKRGHGAHPPMDHWWIQSRLYLLNKRIEAAEDAFISQGHISDAIDMHIKVGGKTVVL